MRKLEQRSRPDAAPGLPEYCSPGANPRPSVTRVPVFRRRRVSPALGTAFLLTLSACARLEQSIEPYLIREWAEVWFGVSLILWMVFGLLIVGGLWWRALAKWDLAEGGPKRRPVLSTLIVSAILCTVAFPLMNFLWDGPIPPEQRVWNSVGWVIGSVLGAIGAWHVGKRLAAWRFQRRFPSSMRENA